MTDRELALAQYRRRAEVYDLELTAYEPIRERALERLRPMPGQTVIDVGCGTGLSFEGLRAALGETGRVVGVDQSPEMAARAEARVRAAGWRNVSVVRAPAHAAPLPRAADAALFHFTHDVLCQPEALAHVLAHLRPGATVVATGLKWAGPWAWPVNWLVMLSALHSVSALHGLTAPWRALMEHLCEVDVETMWFDAFFIASGTVPRRTGSPKTGR